MPGRRRGAAGAYLSPSGAWLASSWTCPGAAARPPPGASSSRPRGPCPPCLSLPPAPRNFAGLCEAKQRQQRDRLSDFSLLCLLQCGKFNSCPPPRAPRGSPPGDKKNHRRNSCDFFFFFLSFFFFSSSLLVFSPPFDVQIAPPQAEPLRAPAAFLFSLKFAGALRLSVRLGTLRMAQKAARGSRGRGEGAGRMSV